MEVKRLLNHLQALTSSYSDHCVKAAIKALLKIHFNILLSEDQSKFKTLHLNDHEFCSTVWHVEPAKQFMIYCGWKEVDGTLHFENDWELDIIINTLVDYREVAFEALDSNQERKIENLDISKDYEEVKSKAAFFNKRLMQVKSDRKHLSEKMQREMLEADIRIENYKRSASRQHEYGRQLSRQLQKLTDEEKNGDRTNEKFIMDREIRKASQTEEKYRILVNTQVSYRKLVADDIEREIKRAKEDEEYYEKKYAIYRKQVAEKIKKKVEDHDENGNGGFEKHFCLKQDDDKNERGSCFAKHFAGNKHHNEEKTW